MTGDLPNIRICGEPFNVDHAMICKRGGFIIQRHNELRDLEAQMLNMVCRDVEVEPAVLQQTTGESLTRGTNAAPDARLDIHARGFWSRQGSIFFDLTLSKFIASMKTRSNVCTQAELWWWNKPRSHRRCLLLQVAWHLSVKSITSD